MDILPFLNKNFKADSVIVYILILSLISVDAIFSHIFLNQISILNSPKGGHILSIFYNGKISIYSYIKIYFLISSSLWALVSLTSLIYIPIIALVLKLILLIIPFLWGSTIAQEW